MASQGDQKIHEGDALATLQHGVEVGLEAGVAVIPEDVGGPAPQRSWMLVSPQDRAIGVVVQGDQLVGPAEIHGLLGNEHQPDVGPQRCRPGFG